MFIDFTLVYYIHNVIPKKRLSSIATQKLPLKFISTLEIANEGLVGVRLGESGNVNTMAYKTTKDGRFSFSKDAWKNFVETTNLSVGQAILITGKTDS